jgi:BirA family biotin operon repressor/biotin-[acetyl-CoA-carboxylase] ligase
VAIASQLKATDSYQLTLATAWGIAAQLQKCSVPAQIKWPNDLVLDGNKLGGILTETKVNQGQITQAVIGVGINWANPVPDTGINLQMWQSSRNLALIPCLEMLTNNVLLGIESGIQCLEQEGIGILLPRYLDLFLNLGDRVHFNHLLATVVGINQQGELRLKIAADHTKETLGDEIAVRPGTISLGYR